MLLVAVGVEVVRCIVLLTVDTQGEVEEFVVAVHHDGGRRLYLGCEGRGQGEQRGAFAQDGAIGGYHRRVVGDEDDRLGGIAGQYVVVDTRFEVVEQVESYG